MNHEVIIQESFLDTLRDNAVPLSIYLINGVRLKGCIHHFDKRTIVLASEELRLQLVYKHAIATIVPDHNIHYTIPQT